MSKRTGITRPRDRIPSLLELSSDPGSVNQVLFGFERPRWAWYASLIPLGIAGIWLSQFSMLYVAALAGAIIVAGTAAANLSPDLYDRLNVGPRALMVGDRKLELVRLPRPDQRPDLLATFERDSVAIEQGRNSGILGTRIVVHDKDGRPLAMLRNCRFYGPDGSRHMELLLAR